MTEGKNKPIDQYIKEILKNSDERQKALQELLNHGKSKQKKESSKKTPEIDRKQ